MNTFELKNEAILKKRKEFIHHPFPSLFTGKRKKIFIANKKQLHKKDYKVTFDKKTVRLEKAKEKKVTEYTYNFDTGLLFVEGVKKGDDSLLLFYNEMEKIFDDIKKEKAIIYEKG